ncbi:MAG TPA: NUDIX domain-containing protein [Sediminibacterium sp.]
MALFNVRVYGLLFDEEKRLLVSDEFIRGEYFTKLPGGGLEFGEGTRDCLQREFLEETGLEVTVGDHIYTTDFFQISAFNKKDQIISVYYKVHVSSPILLHTKTRPFDFSPSQVADLSGCSEVFRWVPWNELSENTMSLPIDKVVIGKVKP